MTEVRSTTGGLAAQRAPGVPGREGGGVDPLPRAVRDTASLKAASALAQNGSMLSDLVAKARAAGGVERDGKAQQAEEPSLAIPGVPVNQPLPVTVKAQITISGTAEVNRMTDDVCEIRLKLKGSAFIFPVERDVTVSLERNPDGSYLYKYRDEKDGSVSEGVAQDLKVEGATKHLTALDRKTGEAVPISITDMGGGRFKIKGDGFEADINKVNG